MREIHDRYFRQAKRENKLARSYYKLAEIDRREKIFTPAVRAVIDLGAAPGSWIEYALEKTASTQICAVDLQVIAKKFKQISRVHFHRGDLREIAPDLFAEISENFDVVVSDMAPATSGVKLVDQARSLELCESAANFATARLRPGGVFICKIFASEEAKKFSDDLRSRFGEVKNFKPAASRDESFEYYVIAKNFRREEL